MIINLFSDNESVVSEFERFCRPQQPNLKRFSPLSPPRHGPGHPAIQAAAQVWPEAPADRQELLLQEGQVCLGLAWQYFCVLLTPFLRFEFEKNSILQEQQDLVFQLEKGRQFLKNRRLV